MKLQTREKAANEYQCNGPISPMSRTKLEHTYVWNCTRACGQLKISILPFNAMVQSHPSHGRNGNKRGQLIHNIAIERDGPMNLCFGRDRKPPGGISPKSWAKWEQTRATNS